MNNFKLIRYNTGTDKKLFTEFASYFDAVIMNATIAAYSGSAMADLVSIYKDRYIIDPQTYILQQKYEMLTSNTAKKVGIKKSISQYLEQLPDVFVETLSNKKEISIKLLNENLDELVDKVGVFELEYITSFIQKKEYNKYLDFINEIECSDIVGVPRPRMLIAPYFMLKADYTSVESQEYLKLNKNASLKFYNKFYSKGYPIASQLVMEKEVLGSIGDDSSTFLQELVKNYEETQAEYIFVWIDDFSPITSDVSISRAFSILIKALNKIGKKPIMAYGGYDSILLCNKDSKTRLYGVAQSVGYGEKRQITPVGGGLPVNKFYFPLTHQRLKSEDTNLVLFNMDLFNTKISSKDRALSFYKRVCDCNQCKEILKNDFDNFLQYYDSNPFTMKNGIRRNRPTQKALEISARHFLYCKVKEWETVESSSFEELVNCYVNNIKEYGKFYDNGFYARILKWVENYVK